MRVLIIVLDYMSFLPPAFLCFLPMKDKLRYSVRRIVATVGTAMLCATLVLGWIQLSFNIESNFVLLPMLAVCFFTYKNCQKATLWQSLAIMCDSLALMSILSNMSTCSGLLLFRGNSGTGLYTPLLQLAFNTLFSAFLAFPYMKFGCYIVNEVPEDSVWQAMMLFSIIVFISNMLILPIEDALMSDNTDIIFMLLLLIAVLLLFLLMHVIFYFIVFGIISQKKIEARNRFLETQESQFISQQRYMKETEKSRHDFRQSIRTLAELYDAGSLEALGSYLHQFVSAMPENDVRYFCDNTALNALLNYYDHLAQQESIRFSVRVRLPRFYPVSDVDMCSMVGNILENAVSACLKADEKRIQLTILTEDAAQIYIVAVNTFNGIVRQSGGSYLSTDRKGSGIGISSVTSTAESYGGVARFSHHGTEFYSNVAIPLT